MILCIIPSTMLKCKLYIVVYSQLLSYWSFNNRCLVDPVRIPVGIAGDENTTVTGKLGSPLKVRCLAYGYPRPCVFWYSGVDEAAMVLYSDAKYEMRGSDLIIKSLDADTVGQYTCGAYNGIGQAVSWKVVVQASEPEEVLIQHPRFVRRSAVLSRPGTQSPTTVEKIPTTTEAPRYTGKYRTIFFFNFISVKIEFYIQIKTN